MAAFRFVAALLALVLSASPALAASVALTGGSALDAEASAEPSPSGEIDSTVDPQDDERIARRANEIFGAIPSLREVRAEVASGVLTLTGSVAEADASNRAEAIAARLSGVVTVQNEIERNLAIDSNLNPALGGLGARLRDLARAAPLIGVALLIAALIGAFGYLVAGRKSLWRRVVSNPFLAELIASAVRFAFVIGGIVLALQILGAGALLGLLAGGAGVLGIAIGFAIRDTIDNYISSLMLSLRQPFRANDLVVIEEHEGRVVRLTSRATILMTLDGNHLRIPNSTVFKAVILNYTRNPERRFQFVLGVDADDDAPAALALGAETMRELDFVLDEPEPGGWIVDVGESNIEVNFVGWVDQRSVDFLKARSKALAAVKAALEEGGFALPEPIYRLRFDPSTPMQMQPAEQKPNEQPERSKQQPRPPKTGADPLSDVSPESHVARMVAEERVTGSAGQDLLDDSRPVE